MSPSAIFEDSNISQTADCTQIPVVDLQSISSTDAESRRRLADEVYKACTEAGFFYIKNHGISDKLIAAVHGAAERFFSLPNAKKMKYYIGKSEKFRGYTPFGAEKSTGIEGDSASSNNEPAPGSLCEAYDIGYETKMDFQKSAEDQLPNDIFNLYGGNQWPPDDELPGFAATYLEYCGKVLELCRKMMRVFALSLDMPENYFDSKMRHPGVTSRMIHYPAQSAKQKVQEGLGAHTDYECFTILSQGNVSGLEVLNSSGEWMLAPPIDGTLVVNVADCLSIWSNRKFRSTIHRVTNRTGRERYSVPFFFGVDYDTAVSVLEQHVSADAPPCKQPFVAGEWIRSKLSKAYVGFNGQVDAEAEGEAEAEAEGKSG